MAKRNQYSFSKRQRELKKKKKQEEKRARKHAKPEDEMEGEYGPEELDPDAVAEPGDEGTEPQD